MFVRIVAMQPQQSWAVTRYAGVEEEGSVTSLRLRPGEHLRDVSAFDLVFVRRPGRIVEIDPILRVWDLPRLVSRVDASGPHVCRLADRWGVDVRSYTQ